MTKNKVISETFLVLVPAANMFLVAYRQIFLKQKSTG